MKLILTALLVFLQISVFSQERLQIKQLGFSMNEPVSWLKVENKDSIVEALKNHNPLTKESDKEILFRAFKKSVNFISYQKYDVAIHKGFIPTINVSVKPKKIKNFEQFQAGIIKVQGELNAVFSDYESQPVEIIQVDGGRALLLSSTYSLKDPYGNPVPVATKTLFIAKNDFLLVIALLESKDQKEEDTTIVFQDLLHSIKITSK